MRMPGAHLVDARHRKPLIGQDPSRTVGRNQCEPHLDELPAGLDQGPLVLVAHRNENMTLKRQTGAAAELRLREGPPEIAIEPHDFAGRFHLRTEDQVYPREAGKREDCLLDRYVTPAATAMGGICKRC